MKAHINSMSGMNNLVLNIIKAKEKRESLVYKILIVRYRNIDVSGERIFFYKEKAFIDSKRSISQKAT